MSRYLSVFCLFILISCSPSEPSNDLAEQLLEDSLANTQNLLGEKKPPRWELIGFEVIEKRGNQTNSGTVYYKVKYEAKVKALQDIMFENPMNMFSLKPTPFLWGKNQPEPEPRKPDIAIGDTRIKTGTIKFRYNEVESEWDGKIISFDNKK